MTPAVRLRETRSPLDSRLRNLPIAVLSLLAGFLAVASRRSIRGDTGFPVWTFVIALAVPGAVALVVSVMANRAVRREQIATPRWSVVIAADPARIRRELLGQPKRANRVAEQRLGVFVLGERSLRLRWPSYPGVADTDVDILPERLLGLEIGHDDGHVHSILLQTVKGDISIEARGLTSPPSGADLSSTVFGSEPPA